MGRGLSELQKTILRLAYHTRRMGGPGEHAVVDAYCRDILTTHFGWPQRHTRHGCYHGPGDQQFNPSEIGEGHYNAARASLSRSLTRLDKRGLIEVFSGLRSHWTGVKLTDAGVVEAKRLMANTAANVRPT